MVRRLFLTGHMIFSLRILHFYLFKSVGLHTDIEFVRLLVFGFANVIGLKVNSPRYDGRHSFGGLNRIVNLPFESRKLKETYNFFNQTEL